MFNDFTWCEVSSFDLSESKCFYESVFKWEISETMENYSTCYSEDRPSAGMMEMPQNFQELELPAFWLSFVKVDSLFDMVNLAVELGGKIEIHPTEFVSGDQCVGKYALVRDPSGAGLMLFEGEDLRGKDRERVSNGRMVWNELHVNSAKVRGVSKFYERLLGWEFIKDTTEQGRYNVMDSKGIRVASLLEIDRGIRGDKNYWMVYFGVDDVDATLKSVKQYGGLVIIDLTATSYGFALVQDTQGAFFCVQGADKLAG